MANNHELLGIHHVTAIQMVNVIINFTEALGMRLVKR